MESLLRERFTDSQTWVVVFDVSLGGLSWWKPFLKKKFRHVHCMRASNSGTLLINPMAHVTAVREYPNSLFDIVQQEINQNPTAILQYTTHYGAHYKPAPYEILTCVSVIKRILGLNTGANTPYQLYKDMLKAGAITIKPFTPHNP